MYVNFVKFKFNYFIYNPGNHGKYPPFYGSLYGIGSKGSINAPFGIKSKTAEGKI
jgi:hypothetical protein